MFAVNFTHPIELVKSRVQVNNMGIIQTCADTMKNEGVAAFWKVRLGNRARYYDSTNVVVTRTHSFPILV